MRHPLIIGGILLASLTANRAVAQDWVAKMITEKNHNFGTVARGADTVHRFSVKNIYKQDIELVSVRSSCGCTSPSLEGKVLKTGEVGYVVASFNTRTFTGVHGATLTLNVAWNDNGVRRTGEAQLRVDGNIRSDIVFQPGAIKFENVEQGTTDEQTVQVSYQGRPNWEITDIRGAARQLEVEFTETLRASGRITYNVLVRLKDSASSGYFNEQIVLVTNDEQNPRIPLHVAGRIVPQISVSPEALLLGEVPSGQEVTKRVVVRGKKPFRIVSIKSEAEGFQFKVDNDNEPSDRHIVEVMFAAKRDAGPVKQMIHITTDLGETFNAALTAYATVVAAEGVPD
jgi:hypothetical protein